MASSYKAPLFQRYCASRRIWFRRGCRAVNSAVFDPDGPYSILQGTSRVWAPPSRQELATAIARPTGAYLSGKLSGLMFRTVLSAGRSGRI
jgi:hypothetical protein